MDLITIKLRIGDLLFAKQCGDSEDEIFFALESIMRAVEKHYGGKQWISEVY